MIVTGFAVFTDKWQGVNATKIRRAIDSFPPPHPGRNFGSGGFRWLAPPAKFHRAFGPTIESNLRAILTPFWQGMENGIERMRGELSINRK